MSDDPARLTRARGRPRQHGDDLRLMLHVEIGRAALGLSVNRLCETIPYRASNGGRLRKSTLKRRYYQRRSLLDASRLPGGLAVASPMGEAVERFLAEVRSVFEQAK